MLRILATDALLTFSTASFAQQQDQTPEQRALDQRVGCQMGAILLTNIKLLLNDEMLRPEADRKAAEQVRILQADIAVLKRQLEEARAAATNQGNRP